MIKKIHTSTYKLYNLYKLGSNPVQGLLLLIGFFFCKVTPSKKIPIIFGKYGFKIKVKCFEKKVYLYVMEILDFVLLENIFLKNEYDIKQLQKATIILDLGANIGYSVIYLACRYASSIIYAFEPNPTLQDRLKKQLEQISDRVEIIPYAVVGNDSTFIQFHISDEHHWSSSIFDKGSTNRVHKVPATTIDYFFETRNLTNVDLIKFDIEGAEYEAFKNFNNINKTNYLIGEYHTDLCQKSFSDFLALFADMIIVKSNQNEKRSFITLRKKVMQM